MNEAARMMCEARNKRQIWVGLIAPHHQQLLGEMPFGRLGNLPLEHRFSFGLGFKSTAIESHE